jgi:hypothetical protein
MKSEKSDFGIKEDTTLIARGTARGGAVAGRVTIIRIAATTCEGRDGRQLLGVQLTCQEDD